jgi:hypothetical protein
LTELNETPHDFGDVRLSHAALTQNHHLDPVPHQRVPLPFQRSQAANQLDYSRLSILRNFSIQTVTEVVSSAAGGANHLGRARAKRQAPVLYRADDPRQLQALISYYYIHPFKYPDALAGQLPKNLPDLGSCYR